MDGHKSSSFNEDGSSRVREKWARNGAPTQRSAYLYTFRRDRQKWERLVRVHRRLQAPLETKFDRS